MRGIVVHADDGGGVLVEESLAVAAKVRAAFEAFARWRVHSVGNGDPSYSVRVLLPRRALIDTPAVSGFQIEAVVPPSGLASFTLGGVRLSGEGLRQLAGVLDGACDPDLDAVLVALGDPERREIELVLTAVASIESTPARSLRLEIDTLGDVRHVKTFAVESIERSEDGEHHVWSILASGERTTVRVRTLGLCANNVPLDQLASRGFRGNRRLEVAGGAVEISLR